MPIVVHHHSVNSVASHPPPPPHSTPIRKLLMYHIIDTHGLNHVNILKKVNTPKTFNHYTLIYIEVNLSKFYLPTIY